MSTASVLRNFVVVGALAGALGGGACAAPQPKLVDFAEVNRSYKGQDYRGVLERWTRHGILIRDVGTVLEAWATFKSWDFRQAYLESYSELYEVSSNAREAMREQQLAATRETFEFHVTAQTTDWRWNDLEKRDSPWQVTLVDGTGAALSPTRIEVLKLPALYEERFFPFKTDFTKTYRIRFDQGAESETSRPFRGAATGRLILRIVGPPGQVDLVWESAS